MLAIKNPFWRGEALSIEEELLLDVLFDAHHRSSYRQNPSTVAVINAANGSGCLSNAISAGLNSLGVRHGPIVATTNFLSLPDPAASIPVLLNVGAKVPGWGGTFQKDAPDPVWHEIHDLLVTYPISHKIAKVTEALHARGKTVYPNPSAYTAAVAIVLGIPPPIAPYLFIAARLSAWSVLAARHILPET
jgi:citrate synthase